WRDETLYQVMMSALSGRSSYTASDMIFLKQGEEVQDAALPLTLNGNSLVEIKQGDRVLVEGGDYDWSEQALIVKRSFLEGLVGEPAGLAAELTVRFSDGADWTIMIIR